MAGEITAALAQIRTLVNTISGLRQTPSKPPESASAYPFAIVSLSEGSWTKESSGQVKGLHTITIEIHQSRTDLPRDLEKVEPYGDLVKDKLLLDANATLNGTVDSIVADDISYTFGALGYAEVITIGWSIDVPVKIRSIESGTSYTKG